MRSLPKGLLLLTLTLALSLVLLGGGPVQAAVSYVAGYSADANTVNIATPQSGDLILVFAYRTGSTAPPTLATNYTSLGTQAPGGSSNSGIVGWKYSNGTETNSGTWTNATNVVALVYRGTHATAPIGALATGAGNGTAIAYNAVTLTVTDGTSWVAGVAGARLATAGMDGSTTNLTNRTSQTIVNGLDTNGGAASFATQTLNVTGTGRWISWAIEILAPPPASDTLSVTSNTPLAGSAAPLATDVQMQRLQVDCSNTGNSSCVMTSVTVDDLGSVVSGDIPNLRVHIDNDTNFANGVLGTVVQPGFTTSSTVVSLLSLDPAVRTVSFGTPKYIWITYDTASSAQGKTMQSRVTAIAVDSPDIGATGTWDSNLINISTGATSTIDSCAGCHDYPALTDSATRDAATGTFVGDHAKHNYVCSKCHVTPATEGSGDFAHRNGNIDMAVPINNPGGTYSLGSSFPQRNNYVTTPTGTCSNINCHSGTVTPQWGVGTTACNSCHNTPPSSGAHAKHYSAKNWANNTTNCTVCHPNNATGHSNVSDGIKIVNATLVPTGSSPAITCNTTGTGCHNGKVTPAWNTTGISCTQCHTAGGSSDGDPSSGLHNTSVVMAHDNQFRNTPGEALPGTANCLSCHTTAPSDMHFDGTVQNSAAATYAWNTSKILNGGYARATDACAANCHRDAGTWNRAWNNVTDAAWSYANDAATADVCGNCHGSFFTGWTVIGETSHINPSTLNDPNTLATSKDSHGECSKCHGWGHSNYSSANMHANNSVEMNSTLGYSNAAGTCSTNCHAGQNYVMNTNSGWTTTTVAGEGVACGDCHNGGVRPGSASAAHAAHGASPAQLVAGGAACVPCHGNNGGANFQSTLAGTHGTGTVNWATNLTYSQAGTRGNLTGTCSGTAGCHVAATNIAWNAVQTNCNTCHYNTADINNWTWTGTAGNISMISSTEYTARGHGQPTINGAAANKGCMDCHDIAVAHDKTPNLDGANPFRLKSGFSCNNIAAGCHSVSGLYTTHEQATAGSKYTWSFGAKCVDCHDPHGDGSNLAMIHSDLADKGSKANWVRNAPDAAIEPMVFTSTAGTAADSYAEPSPNFDGICQECHTQTASFRDNTSAAAGTHAANTSGCMNCHNHKNDGFKGAGCNGCHGGDNATIGNKNFWPGGSGTLYPKRPGEHNVHIQRLATKLGYPFNDTLTDQQQITMCAYCHTYTTAPGEGGHDDNVAPANVGSFDRIWASLDVNNYPVYADTAPAPGYSGGNGTGGSCSGIDCHNNVTTPATHEWYDGATSNCVMCHTKATSGSNPSSGLHYGATAPTVSSTWHDNTLNGNANDCLPCHTMPAYSAAGTHINGTFSGNSTIAGDRTALGLTFSTTNGYTQTADNVGTCIGTWVSGCHPGGDAGTWARRWDSSIHYGTLVSMAPCAGCHGGFNNDWTFGTTANTTDGSVEHNRNWDGDGNPSEVIGNHSNGTDKKCNSCHVYGDGAYVWGTHHRNNQITMNSTVGYQRTTTTPNYGCTNSCHASNVNHGMENSSWTLGSLAGPALDCTGCHSTIYNGGAGTHIDADGPGTAFIPGTTAGTTLCQACHQQHAQASDNTGANKIIISTRDGSNNPIPTMTDSGGNALYSTHGFKIWLGGTATSNTAYTTAPSANTEAQMCWGCHEKVTQNHYTVASGTSVTITAPATIAATGIGNKFPVGRWITVFGSANAANNRTFKVATSSANSITVTIPQYNANLVSTAASTAVTIISPVSEWQVNEAAATGNIDYDYGMLFSTIAGNTLVSDWTTGIWRSAKGLNNDPAHHPFWYKRGSTRSTHSANIGGTNTAALTGTANSLGYAGTRTETKDAVANIRCSYCHDVHGTHDGIRGDSVSGKPYLRGTWKGNPYPEDGAPQFGMTNFTIQSTNTLANTYPYGTITLTNTNYGVVPRAAADPNNSGLVTVNKVGGFWIDQNSGDPNSGSSANATSSLCELCHGNGDGSWSATEIGSIDWTKDATEGGTTISNYNLWVSGYNGHANAVISGPGRGTNSSAESYARNIFTRTLRGNATLDTGSTQTGKWNHNMGAVGGSQGVTFRASTTGYLWYPRVAQNTELGTNAGPGSRPYAMNVFAWNGGTGRSTVNSGTGLTQNITAGTEATHDAQANYHTFTCSKCHNPHASRLPKLMITNCLDSNHNTWDNKNTLTGNALPSPYTNLRHSQWSTAQNCHRLDERAVLTSGQVITLGKGWNKVTPWREFDSPSASSTTAPTPSVTPN